MWKKIITAAGLLFLFSAVVLFAGEEQGPLLTFAAEEYDLGTIYYEDVGIKTIEIELFNTGDAPLIIKHIHACCGTTVAYRPRKPVLPGENAKIGLRFRVMKKPYAIQRLISVESNSADSPLKRLPIKGRVKQKPLPEHPDALPEN